MSASVTTRSSARSTVSVAGRVLAGMVAAARGRRASGSRGPVGGAASVLLVMSYGASTPAEEFCRILGVLKPDYLKMASDDFLRLGRLGFLVESQFQIENG